MTERDLAVALRTKYQARARRDASIALRERVRAIPALEGLPSRRISLPPLPARRFQTMFSATKFVVAGAIVALFGGFLLSGVLLRQPGEVHAGFRGRRGIRGYGVIGELPSPQHEVARISRLRRSTYLESVQMDQRYGRRHVGGPVQTK